MPFLSSLALSRIRLMLPDPLSCTHPPFALYELSVTVGYLVNE